jgi:hypothetical protein
MLPNELGEQLQQRLLSFCWREWAQMGILAAPPAEPSRWPQDPEALIVLTLAVARAEARLFDEQLDWMAVNERMLSLRRLRAMCIDDEDRALVAAASGWLTWQRPRRAAPGTGGESYADLQELFQDGGPIRELDPSFAAAGLARPRLERSGRSLAPDLSLPINFALRLRAILGVGIRAEVVRIMIGTRANWMTAQVLSRSSTYSKRNVHDALAGLSDAGVISAARISGELRYTVDLGGWGALLGHSPEDLPAHREWATLFAVLRRVLRWAQAPERRDASDYIIASEARQLLDELRPALAYANIALSPLRDAADAPEALSEMVQRTLQAISA